LAPGPITLAPASQLSQFAGLRIGINAIGLQLDLQGSGLLELTEVSSAKTLVLQ
jgi:hypothetical protein